MALKPTTTPLDLAALRLIPFDRTQAEEVVSWAPSPREMFWLAPKTRPPLTADKLRRWLGPGREPLQLVTPANELVAYGELNTLDAAAAHYWLGHLVVRPTLRGRGVGRVLTERLLHRAFTRYAARRVSLVVFPENHAAVACYRAAGFSDVAVEEHYVRAYARTIHLLRMTATRS